jgi:hypothetical protein
MEYIWTKLLSRINPHDWSSLDLDVFRLSLSASAHRLMNESCGSGRWQRQALPLATYRLPR